MLSLVNEEDHLLTLELFNLFLDSKSSLDDRAGAFELLKQLTIKNKPQIETLFVKELYPDGIRFTINFKTNPKEADILFTDDYLALVKLCEKSDTLDAVKYFGVFKDEQRQPKERMDAFLTLKDIVSDRYRDRFNLSVNDGNLFLSIKFPQFFTINMQQKEETTVKTALAMGTTEQNITSRLIASADAVEKSFTADPEDSVINNFLSFTQLKNNFKSSEYDLKFADNNRLLSPKESEIQNEMEINEKLQTTVEGEFLNKSIKQKFFLDKLFSPNIFNSAKQAVTGDMEQILPEGEDAKHEYNMQQVDDDTYLFTLKRKIRSDDFPETSMASIFATPIDILASPEDEKIEPDNKYKEDATLRFIMQGDQLFCLEASYKNISKDTSALDTNLQKI
ncbi:MAG: hypothetical protein OXD32_05840 [Endozoicomonadaceae bacterium]|nr:hypothetical protein [Endozoicomonadaceae bacterium]